AYASTPDRRCPRHRQLAQGDGGTCPECGHCSRLHCRRDGPGPWTSRAVARSERRFGHRPGRGRGALSRGHAPRPAL
ncbi:MAG: hypothetical protein AVDCRST_MAG43-1814, partial [uncultured Thermomicrobiales bacterium]